MFARLVCRRIVLVIKRESVDSAQAIPQPTKVDMSNNGVHDTLAPSGEDVRLWCMLCKRQDTLIAEESRCRHAC